MKQTIWAIYHLDHKNLLGFGDVWTKDLSRILRFESEKAVPQHLMRDPARVLVEVNVEIDEKQLVKMLLNHK